MIAKTKQEIESSKKLIEKVEQLAVKTEQHARLQEAAQQTISRKEFALISMESTKRQQETVAFKLAKRTASFNQERKNQMIELLQLMGMPVIHAPYEAEQVCASLTEQSYTAASVSEDSDTYLYGSGPVLQNVYKGSTKVQMLSSGEVQSYSIFRELMYFRL